AAKSISGEAGRSSTYFFQRLYQIGFSRLVHRRKASQQAGGDRNGADKCKNGRGEADRSNSSKACRADLHQEFESGPAESKSEAAADTADQQAFDQQLPGYSRFGRSEDDSQRDFPASSIGSCKQKIGNIETTDEQDESGSKKEHHQGGPNVADNVLLKRRDQQPEILAVIVGELIAQPFRHGIGFVLCLLDCGAWTQTAQEPQIIGARVRINRVVERHPRLDVRGNV